ncbi:MarR family transcriptional regulator [Dactylosporangium aurantiacum]|uniref:MarR family transcriptional regulator n=1 Tax=Dactylosporangium aurantiacum TaxID=35754 RepID=UPI0034E07E71
MRSPFQGELLAWLCLHPGAEYPLIELARRLGVSHATASREADRLAAAGLVLERRFGNVRLTQQNPGRRDAGPGPPPPRGTQVLDRMRPYWAADRFSGGRAAGGESARDS